MEWILVLFFFVMDSVFCVADEYLLDRWCLVSLFLPFWNVYRLWGNMHTLIISVNIASKLN